MELSDDSKREDTEVILRLPDLNVKRVPKQVLLHFAWDLLRAGPAELADYAPDLLKALDPPVQWFETEHLPRQGRLLVLANHFTSPGFNVIWNALLTMQALRSVYPTVPMRWVMTRQWTYLTPINKLLFTRVTRFGFVRFAQTFGHVSMPPLPPQPGDETERALAVRRWLKLSTDRPEAVLCMMPEGRGGQGLLVEPHEGVGRVVLATIHTGRIAIPAAIYPEQRRLTVRFGSPLDFNPVQRLPIAEQDRATIDLIMYTLAAMLPSALRGPYANTQ